MVVSDHEPEACVERLELLAVVRALEALDGPTRVTLVTKSRYVSRGLRTCLTEWRANEWQWERFGRIVAVKDYDLWQRIDRALLFHKVECQPWQFEESDPSEPLVSPALDVEAERSRCSETLPPSCEADGVVAEKRERRLTPTKRRLVQRRRINRPAKSALGSPSVGNWAAAVASKARQLTDSIRGLGQSEGQFAQGIA